MLVLLTRTRELKLKLKLKPNKALDKNSSLSYGHKPHTCHMGSHSLTCHPTYANAPRLNLTKPVSWYSIYLPRRDGRLSWPRLSGSAAAGSRTRDLSVTNPIDGLPLHHRDTRTVTPTAVKRDRRIFVTGRLGFHNYLAVNHSHWM